MKAVLFVNAGNGFWIPSKSDGRGTIDRLDGTITASQLPICASAGAAFIGPRLFLCTTEVWYVSQVFSIKYFQLQSTT